MRWFFLAFLLFASGIEAETVFVGPERVPIEIPKDYVRTFESIDGSTYVFTRPSPSSLDELILSAIPMPAALSKSGEWEIGHEFTWGQEMLSDDLSFLPLRPGTRVSRGLRMMVAYKAESRVAAFFPGAASGVTVFLRGNAEDRLLMDLQAIAVSTGATPRAAPGLIGICGGCGGPTSGGGISRRMSPVALALLLCAALPAGWFVFKALQSCFRTS